MVSDNFNSEKVSVGEPQVYREKDSHLEIRPLTSLRMIAALLVFLQHFRGLKYGTIETNIWDAVVIEGHIGVTIFFVLSGFLLTLRYYDVFLNGKFNLYEYFSRRVARIYPLYFELLILVAIIDRSSINWTNWTLTQGFFTSLRFTGISTAWSLTTEESFYLLLPLFFVSVARFRPNIIMTANKELIHLLKVLLIWTGILIVIGLALIVISSQTGVDPKTGFMSDIHIALYMTIFFRFSNFGIGIFCACFYQRILSNWWKTKQAGRLAYGALVVSLASTVVLVYLMNHAGGVYGDGWIYNYFVALSSGLLILSLTYEHTFVAQIMSHPLLVYMGRISYALYLVQTTPIATGVLNLVKLLFGISGFLISYIALNGLSAALYELIEKNGVKAVKTASSRLANTVKVRRAALDQ